MPCRYTVLEEMSGGGGAVDKLVVPCCVLLLHGSRYIGRPDGATADADKPVIACHVFDSPKPTFRGGAVGSGGQQLGDTMVGAGLLFGDDFCDVADGKPRTRQSPGDPPPSWSPGNPRSSRGLPQGVPVGYASGDGAPSARSASAA